MIAFPFLYMKRGSKRPRWDHPRRPSIHQPSDHASTVRWNLPACTTNRPSRDRDASRRAESAVKKGKLYVFLPGCSYDPFSSSSDLSILRPICSSILWLPKARTGDNVVSRPFWRTSWTPPHRSRRPLQGWPQRCGTGQGRLPLCWTREVAAVLDEIRTLKKPIEEPVMDVKLIPTPEKPEETLKVHSRTRRRRLRRRRWRRMTSCPLNESSTLAPRLGGTPSSARRRSNCQRGKDPCPPMWFQILLHGSKSSCFPPPHRCRSLHRLRHLLMLWRRLPLGSSYASSSLSFPSLVVFDWVSCASSSTACFDLDYMFHLLIGRASSSTASIHKSVLLGRNNMDQNFGFAKSECTKLQLIIAILTEEHKKETTNLMATGTGGYLKTVQNTYDTCC
jgi:hypothetical protein